MAATSLSFDSLGIDCKPSIHTASSPVAPPRFGLAERAKKDGKGRESGALRTHAQLSRVSRTGEEETVEEAAIDTRSSGLHQNKEVGQKKDKLNTLHS